jgi:type II secretory pathway component GspD/PulD (secretin)
MTPNGMVVASDDPLALSDFEQMMRTLADQSALSSAEPTVFWLKYAKAPEAADLITKVLGGDTGGGGGGGGGGLASSVLGELGGGMLGGLLGFGGDSGGSGARSSILTTTGSVSIVADGRLNALIVQANAVDMQTIEMILEVIDREESPEDVRTTSKPQLIPVIYQNATDVANIVKSVYADRSGEQSGGRGQQQVSPQDLINAIRGGGGGGGRGGRGGNEQATKPAPVIIAVDSRSNSLIVTAPPHDVQDIRELVEAIDAGGMQSEETVEIVSLKGNVKAQVVQQALDSILGTKAKSTTATAATAAASAPGQTTGGDNPSSDDIQRRIEFFRQLRERGGLGGAPGGAPGGGFPGGGGPPSGMGGSSRGGAPTGGGGGGTRGRSGR